MGKESVTKEDKEKTKEDKEKGEEKKTEKPPTSDKDGTDLSFGGPDEDEETNNKLNNTGPDFSRGEETDKQNHTGTDNPNNLNVTTDYPDNYDQPLGSSYEDYDDLDANVNETSDRDREPGNNLTQSRMVPGGVREGLLSLVPEKDQPCLYGCVGPNLCQHKTTYIEKNTNNQHKFHLGSCYVHTEVTNKSFHRIGEECH